MPIQIGMLTVSLPPALSTVPAEAVGLADELSARAADRLTERGCQVRRIEGQQQSESAVLDAVKQLEDADVDCVVFVIGSWIYVPMVVTAARKLTKPFVLWGLTHMVLSASVSSCITHGGLDEMGIKHKFVFGMPDEDEIIDEIVVFARAAFAKNQMDGMRYGLLGGRCMYMYTAMPDLIQIKQLFGVETAHIDQYDMVLRARKIDKQRVDEFVDDFRSRYGTIEPDAEVLERSVRVYFALKDMARDYQLDFMGVKCMPEVVSNYCSCCVGVSHMNNDGVVTACEADTNAALTMQVLNLLAGTPAGFADVFTVDKKSGDVRLVNCGVLATDLAASHEDVDWALQYEFIGPARGCTSVFVCKPGRITLARLARVKGQYVMQITMAQAYSEPKEKMKEARDRWPHLFFTMDGDPRRFIQNCRSNHQHWVYGDFKNELLEWCEMMEITPIVT